MSKQQKNGLRNVKVLTTAAMLGALSVVIGIFCKNYLNISMGLFRITFEHFPIILTGLLFGPWVGFAVGLVSDMISYMLSIQSFGLSLIVSLGSGLVGFTSGIISHYVIKKSGTLQIIISTYAAHLVGTVIVKSIGLFRYYGWLVLWRIPTYAVIATLEVTLLIMLYKHKAFRKYLR